MSKKYSFFVLMRATKAWLSLSRAERNQFTTTVLNPILRRYPAVGVRFYDAEAFSTKCSDVAVFETAQLEQYYYVMEAIRDTAVFTVPYFEFVEIIPALEGGFGDYEAHLQEGNV